MDGAPSAQKVVMPVHYVNVEPAPGPWDNAKDTGHLLMFNNTAEEQSVGFGQTIAVICEAYVQTRACGDCGLTDTDALLVDEKGEEPSWVRTHCERCNSGQVSCHPWISTPPEAICDR